MAATVFTFLPKFVRGNAPSNSQSLCLAENAHFRNIAFAPDGAKAYVTGDGIGGIVEIDAKTNSVIGKIPIMMNTEAIAFSADGKNAFVTSTGNNPTMAIIDLHSNTVAATVKIGSDQFQIKGIAVASNDQEIYIPAMDGTRGLLLVLNSKTGSISHKIPVQNIGDFIVISPDGKKAFLREKSISTIDLAKKVELQTIPTKDVGAIAISPNGSYFVYSESGRPGIVEVISSNRNQPFASIALIEDPITTSNPIGITLPFTMAFTPDSRRLYVAHHTTRPGKISVVDLQAKSVIGTISAGTFPTSLAISPDGGKMYVLAPTDESLSISVIDVKKNRVSGSISGIKNSMAADRGCH